jgi:hypothetical protein
MRFLASGGWADQDPDVLGDLLRQAQALASVVATDENASSGARAMARRFLSQLEADALE